MQHIEYLKTVLFILQMVRIFVFLALAVLNFGEIHFQELTEEIANTKELINLYNKKLLLLKQLYHQHYPHIPYAQTLNQEESNNSKQITKIARLNQKLVLLKKLQHHTIYSHGGYLINNNKILDVNSFEELGQFIGDVLVSEPDKLTTLVGGKLGITEIKKKQKTLEKYQYLTGKDAQQMKSVWHRNLNIKDAEDVLIQWDNRKIRILGKQIKQISLQEKQNALKVFSFNQYKAILVTNTRVGIINRLQQLTDSNFAHNFSKSGESNPLIICADFSDNQLIALLNTGQLARFISEKMLITQTILNTKYDFQLEEGLVFMQQLQHRLFVIHKKLGIIKIFNNVAGKFILNINLHLPYLQPQTNYQLFKVNGSIRLIVSTQRQSYIYELLLPTSEDSPYTPGYLKIIGAIAVIGCFIYFKMKKENSIKKADDNQYVSNRLNYDPQIQQYLKRQAKEQLLQRQKKN